MAEPVFTPEQEARINDLLIEYLAQNGASIDEGINVTELTGDALTDENLKKLTIPSILPTSNRWAYTSLGNMMAPITHAISQLETDDAQVQQAISDASTAADNANDKASEADTAAGDASNAAVYAEHQADYAKEWNEHPPYVADGSLEYRGDPYYIYFWDINTHAYVRGAYVKGADLDYNTMTEEEYNRLVENVKSSVLFATVDTCESIVGELV
jgi:hypothetical protein